MEAQSAYDKIIADFGGDQHLEHSRQPKACGAAVDRLRKWARKLSKSNDDELRNYSQQLFDSADEVEERQSMFDDARNKFTALVSQAPSKPRLAVMKTMTNATICSLVSREAPRISDSALGNQMDGRALYLGVVAHTSPTLAQGLGLYLIKDDNTLVKQAQRPIIHSHLESIFKQPSPSALATAASNFLGGSDLAAMGYDRLAEELDNVPEKISNSDDSLLFGWCPQLFADMVCALTMGEVSRCLALDIRIPGQIHGLVRKLVANRGKLSGRVRCYHKHIGGVSHAARDSWRAIEQISESDLTQVNCTASEVDSWLLTLRKTRLEGEPVDLLCCLGEVICDDANYEKVVSVAAWMTHAEEAGGLAVTHQDLLANAQELRDELRECMGKVISDSDWHEPAWAAGIGPREKENELQESEPAVRDVSYFENPDNLPDEIAVVGVTAQLGSLLKSFPQGGAELACITEASRLAGSLMMTWKLANYDITKSHSIFDKLRQYGDLARKQLTWQAPGQGGRIPDGNKGINKIQQFVDKATSAEFLEKAIEQFVTGVLTNTTNLAAVRRELVALNASFPANVQTLITAAKSFDNVEVLAERIRSGKMTPTLKELNTVLDQAVAATAKLPLATKREAYVAAKEVCGKEFGSLFAFMSPRFPVWILQSQRGSDVHPTSSLRSMRGNLNRVTS